MVGVRWRFSTRDLVVYIALTLVQLAAIGWAFSRLVHSGWSRGIATYTLLIPFIIAMVLVETRWFTLPLMKVPVHQSASDGWRVAVVTTFVPGSEAIEMLDETVRALVAMRYPHDTWVLDEGDDPDVRELCRRAGAHHATRRHRPEHQTAGGEFAARTKHGNYNAWLAVEGYDRYDVIVNVDPDHILQPDFLERTLGYLDDPDIGYVQAAQAYYNQPASLIAQGAAEETYSYYSSIQMTSFAFGYPIVTGCHTVHRTTALRAIGGFCAHDADDLLSTIYYRAERWRGVYVPEILGRGLTPVDWPSYLSQQRRWASSVLDVKFRIYPRMARRLRPTERIVSFIHGLTYLQGIGSALSLTLLCAALVHGWASSAGLMTTLAAPLAVAGALFACDLFRQTFYLDRRHEWGIHWRAGLLRFAKWPWILLALADAIRGRARAYSITRKTTSASRGRPQLAAVHLAVGGVVLASLVIGRAVGAHHPPALLVLTGVYLLFTFGSAATELIPPAQPFDPNLAARVRPVD